LLTSIAGRIKNSPVREWSGSGHLAIARAAGGRVTDLDLLPSG